MAEKGEVSVDTVSLPPTYAPSEAYTDSPPPAYKRAKSTTVQVARMVCITLLAAAFMIGFFTLTSNYLSAKECDCHNSGHKHGGFHSASVFPQVEKLVGEEGLNKINDMNGNGIDAPEESILSKDIIQQEMEEVAVPDAQEELDDNVPDDVSPEEIQGLLNEIADLEESEKELEEEIEVEDVIQEQIEEMKKRIKLPIDLLLGNPSMAGRDVNCEVERRQQPIGGGIVSQAIIVTCSDDDDKEVVSGPTIISPPGARRVGPPLSFLAPIMKMLSRSRLEKPMLSKINLSPPSFPLSSGPRPCSPDGPFPCFPNQPRSMGPFPAPFNGPNNGPLPGSINNPFPVQFNGPMPNPMSGPFPGSDGPFPLPNGPFPQSNGPFPRVNGPFPQSNGPFPRVNGPFPQSNGPFPRANGPFPGPLPGPNPGLISRHISIPLNEPRTVPFAFQRPNQPFSNGPFPMGPKPAKPIIMENKVDEAPRDKMISFGSPKLIRISPRMPRILALATKPNRLGLQTPISSLQRGANISPREPKIISTNPISVPEAQRRALPSPISLPGIRILPARLLSAPSFLGGIRRDDTKPVTHMEMRKPEFEINEDQFKPRFPDFGPPKVRTVIGPNPPRVPQLFDQFPPNNPPKELLPSAIISKVIEVNGSPIPKDIMSPPKPIAVIHKAQPMAGSPPHFPIFPPPPPPPPKSFNRPPPPPKMDPTGRSGFVREFNPDAEIIVGEPKISQPSPNPQPPQHMTKEVHERAPQQQDDRKHHLLIMS